MRVGFTGTRSGMSEPQYRMFKREFLRYIGTGYDVPELHHGLCVGADSQAHVIARMLRRDGTLPIKIVAHPPRNNKWKAHLSGVDDMRDPKEYLARNHDIVDECDRLIACPAGPEELKSGTWATIRYARKRRKPITIIWRNGSVTEER